MTEIIKSEDLKQEFAFIRRDAGDRAKYPWGQVEVGEGFLVNGTKKERLSVQCQASVRGRELGRRFMTRTVPDGLLVVRKE